MVWMNSNYTWAHLKKIDNNEMFDLAGEIFYSINDKYPLGYESTNDFKDLQNFIKLLLDLEKVMREMEIRNLFPDDLLYGRDNDQ